jgi:hypothetical protein
MGSLYSPRESELIMMSTGLSFTEWVSRVVKLPTSKMEVFLEEGSLVYWVAFLSNFSHLFLAVFFIIIKL